MCLSLKYVKRSYYFFIIVLFEEIKKSQIIYPGFCEKYSFRKLIIKADILRKHKVVLTNIVRPYQVK